ncbi:MAG: sulfatase [Candidatus Hydrogenedentales bacterium]|jgi:arylsulfatase A-like enzyme
MTRTRDEIRSSVHLFLRAITLVATQAFLFGFCELVVASRSPLWMGGSREQWIVWFGACAAYAAVILLLAFCFFLLLSILLKNAIDAEARLVAGILLSSLFVLLFLAISSSKMEGGWPVLVAASLVGCGMLGIALMRLELAGLIGTSIMTMIAVAGGASLLQGATDLIAPSRPNLLQVTAVAHVCIVLGVSVAALAMFRQHASRGKALCLALPLCGVAAFLPLGLGLLPGKPGSGDGRANVLLITADTLRADYCGTYGGPAPTPALERLAANGVNFTQCKTLAPWTVPSICGMFSSKYPPSISVEADASERELETASYFKLAGYWQDPDSATSVNRFSQNGYVTAAVCGNGILADQRWLLEDFHESLMFSTPWCFYDECLGQVPIVGDSISLFAPDLLPRHTGDTTAIAARFAKRFLERRRSEPFFLWVHFFDPHAPYTPPVRFYGPGTPDPGEPLPQDVMDGSSTLTRDEARALYLGEIRYVDEGVGEILDALDAHGLTDSTFVCFSADHGEEFWDHEGQGHGHSLFDELLHVPLIMSGPGIVPAMIDKPVSSIHTVATLLDLAGLEQPESGRGTSLKQVLLGEDFDALAQPCFAQATRGTPLQMVQLGDYKLIRNLDSRELLLFDVEHDPQELHNLATAHPDTVTALEERLRAWQDSFPWDFGIVTGRAANAIALHKPSEAERDALAALGYL